MRSCLLFCFIVSSFFSSLGAHLSGWTIISKIKKNAKLSCNMITLRYVTLSRGVQDRTLFLIAVTAEYWFLCSFSFSFAMWCLFVYCWRCQFRAIHRNLIVKEIAVISHGVNETKVCSSIFLSFLILVCRKKSAFLRTNFTSIWTLEVESRLLELS